MTSTRKDAAMVTNWVYIVCLIAACLALGSCNEAKPTFFGSAYSNNLATRASWKPDPAKDVRLVEIYEFSESFGVYQNYNELLKCSSSIKKVLERGDAQELVASIRDSILDKKAIDIPTSYVMDPRQWHILIFSEDGSIAYWRAKVIKTNDGDNISLIYTNPETSSFSPICLDWRLAVLKSLE